MGNGISRSQQHRAAAGPYVTRALDRMHREARRPPIDPDASADRFLVAQAVRGASAKYDVREPAPAFGELSDAALELVHETIRLPRDLKAWGEAYSTLPPAQPGWLSVSPVALPPGCWGLLPIARFVPMAGPTREPMGNPTLSGKLHMPRTKGGS